MCCELAFCKIINTYWYHCCSHTGLTPGGVLLLLDSLGGGS